MASSLLFKMEDIGGVVAETSATGSATQPRAYQLELFEESMKRNIIVTVRIENAGSISIEFSDVVPRWIQAVVRHKCK